MPRSRKEATDRLLSESRDLLAGVEEEPDEVTARHDVENLNGGGSAPHRQKEPSYSGLEVSAPGGFKMHLQGVSGVTIVAVLLVGGAVLLLVGRAKGWW